MVLYFVCRTITAQFNNGLPTNGTAQQNRAFIAAIFVYVSL
jgi:hypothetical protein